MTNKLKKYFIKYKYTGTYNDVVEGSCILELLYTDLNLDSIKRILADELKLDCNPLNIEILLATLL